MVYRSLLSAIWFVGLLVAWGEPVAAPAGPAPARADPLWLEVGERTTCEAMRDEYCLGRYGFTIRHGGTFAAGRAGETRVVEGNLTPRELQELDPLVRQAASSAREGKPTCRKSGLPGIRDQVDLTLSDGTVIRIYDLGGQVGQLCCVGSWDRARRLHDYLRKLMNRYYPVPFPTR